MRIPSSRHPGSALLVGLVAAWLAAGCGGPQPSETVPEEVARLNDLGTAFLGQQKWGEAETVLRQALEQRPDDPLLRNNLAVALIQQGRLDEAESELRRALAAAPDHAHANYSLGLLLKDRGEFGPAAEHFEAVRRLDPDDLMTRYNLGVVYSRLERTEEAEAAFRQALEQDPAHVSSLYALGRLLLQDGREAEGARLIDESQRIRARSGLDEAVGSQYGEQGPYAMGAEYAGDVLAAPQPIELAFEAQPREPTRVAAWAVARLAPDGRVAPIVATDGAALSLPEPGGKLVPVLAAAAAGSIRALGAGDLDGDAVVELVALVVEEGGAGSRLRPFVIEQDETGRFAPAAQDVFGGAPAVELPDDPSAAAVALVDRDHDGDLDAVWCWATTTTSGCRLGTNDGRGKLEVDAGDGHGFTPSAAGADWLWVGFSDVDNDRDVDLLLAEPGGIQVLVNQRDGTFVRDERAGMGEATGELRAVAVADLDKNGWMDLVLGGSDGLCWRSNRRGRFQQAQRIAEAPVRALVVLDADNDGFLDVVAADADGRLAAYRNVGRGGWSPRPEWFAAAAAEPDAAGAGLLDLDADRDGDLDLFELGQGVRLLRNRGGNAQRWIVVDSRGVGDNTFGIGAKVEVLAGALRQKFEVTDVRPLHVGLGSRETVESVRHLWPSGVLQDEIRLVAGDVREVTQLDRKGTSCPLLYAWRDGGWRFVTDFLGGCAIGYQLAPGVYGTPDTDEYVKIEGGLHEDGDGVLRLRLNNQLQEVIWFDQVELLVVDHPAGTEVFPNERLMPGPPWPEFELFASRDVRPLARARGVESGEELTDTLRARDRRWVADFALHPYKGYAELHTLELDLGPFDHARRAVLLLDGWIDYADSSANVAAHQAGLALVPPRLTVADGRGGWRETGHRMGFPAGLPKTMAVELTGLFPADDHRVRIATNMRIYWDRARLMVGGERTPLRVRRVAPERAELGFGGYPAETSPDGRPPFAYDPQNVARRAPWKAHVGLYTGFGEVTELLLGIDDRLVTTRSGDEIELRFAAPPAPPAGWSRTFLLYADGFGKDMDPNSAANAAVGPIPFHGMPTYPYPDDVAPPVGVGGDDGRPRRVLDSPRGWPGVVPQALVADDGDG